MSWAAATGGTPPYVYSLPTILSSGFTFDLHTRRLIWDATVTVGTHAIVVRVEDSATPPVRVNSQFSLVVNAPIVPLAWTFDWVSSGQGDIPWLARVVNAPYTILPQPEHGVPPYTWSIANEPTGVMINAMNGHLSNTVALVSVGRHPIVLTVVDSAGTSISQTFWLNVAAN